MPNGFSIIIVVVDRLSKYGYFIALKHPYSAKTVAEVFVKEVVCLHGMPRSIVSDRDPIFTSQFWSKYFRLQGSKLSMSSAYHPQTNGQTEVLNRYLETYLHCFTGSKQKQWLKWLPWAEYWYNTSYHTATRTTPFEVVYGRAPIIVHNYEHGATAVVEVDQSLKERDEMLKLLKENLVTAQNWMKISEDRHRRELEFEPGDFVYLKLQPFRQLTIRTRGNMKPSPHFYGPY